MTSSRSWCTGSYASTTTASWPPITAPGSSCFLTRARGPGTGTLRFEDDGDYLEGRNDFGIAALGTVVNQGLIIKSGGNGTSLVTGTYSQPVPGRGDRGQRDLVAPIGVLDPGHRRRWRRLRIGSLSGSGTARLPGADVRRRPAERPVPGADRGHHRCLGRDPGADDHLVACRHRLPGRGTRHRPVGRLAAAPAILSLRYDERILDGRGWTSVNVFRRATGTTPYVALQPCLANGGPPSGQVACVDRRGLAGSSRNVVDAEGPGAAPDVIMVIRTVDTSRWVAR